jgi:uncharacterized protein involved in response to NO
MVLAMMTRVVRGHAGRPLEADHVTSLIYATVILAAVTRVATAFADTSSMALFGISALLWVTSFLLFVWKYWPMLVFPRNDEDRPPA